MSDSVLYTILLCIALASAETLHGIFRAAILVPKIGKRSALRVGIITGSILAFLVCYFFVPRINVEDNLQLIGIGVIVSSFMAFFDIALSMTVLRRSLRKSLKDFIPGTGNYLIFGLLLLIIYPVIVMKIR